LALDFIAQESVWESVEAVAAELERRQIDGANVERIADKVYGRAGDPVAALLGATGAWPP